jgi:hypothetical protein
MCYNQTTSFLTFTIMAISTIYLIYRNYPNDRWVAIVFISAGLMQLLEYFMWKDQSCGLMNHLATIGALLLLLIQPIAILFGAYYFGDLVIDRRKLAPIIWIYGIIIGIFGINWINYASKKRLCSRPNGRHLDWDFSKWINSPVMKIFWIMYYLVVLLFFMSRPWYLGGIVGILLIGSLLFSVFYVKNTSWKSWWCWIINIIPIIYIILSYFIHKQQN